MRTNRHHSTRRKTRYLGRAAFQFVLWLGIATAEALAQGTQKNLAEMSLEDLMNVEVTSVAKREQTLSETAAAVYVITQEDIRRAGATSIPEALRLAPGVQVAQINAHAWAITIRGFNYRYANKLLVLIDGRTVYTPLFSGTVWNLEDLMLEDIERIEVIRGPGASLWGANAVNGVINIITKPAGETQGGLLTATGSSRCGSSAVRYGAKAKEQFVYRVFGKYSQLSPQAGLASLQSDAWYTGRGGFRAEWSVTPQDSITFSGDAYRGAQNEAYTTPLLTPPYSVGLNRSLTTNGGDILSRWRHGFSNGAESTLQIYYDRMEFALPLARFQQDVVDVDYQYGRPVGTRQQWIGGLGYRATREVIRDNFMMWFNSQERPWWQPNKELRSLFNGFLQDEIALVPGRLDLTMGSKFESNEYTGFEYQPSLRLRWRVHARNSLWASVSRAVRTPSDYEEESRIGVSAMPGPEGLPYLTTLFGNHKLRSEQLLAYEAGYRGQPSRRLSFDLSSFYNIYHRLVGQNLLQPFLESTPTPAHIVVPMQFENNHDGRSYGLELSGNYIPRSFWKLTGSYSWLRMSLKPANVYTTYPVGSNPSHTFEIHSYLSLPRSLEFDNGLYWVDRLVGQPVPPYLRLDSRVAWHPQERLEFSVSGQNLLRPLHPEFVLPFDIQGVDQVSRTVSGKVTWQF